GEPDAIGEPRRDPSHQRALAPVAVTTRPECDPEPSGRQAPRRLEDSLEGVRRVSVVDHDQEILSGLHALESTRHPCYGGGGGGDGGGFEAERQTNPHGPEQIHHVVLTDEGRDDPY